ncbi:TPA: hypothetical protein DIS61_05275 [Patescibacteria group bacterium]|nr:hypothetical protein [Patescibacteria group bacterium]
MLRKTASLIAGFWLVVSAVLWLSQAQIAWAASCVSGVNTQTLLGKTLVPLTDLGLGLYQGYPGGLYPNSQNTRPGNWETAGQQIKANIYPRDANGNRDDVNGKIVLLTIGMSNATMESYGWQMASGEPLESFKTQAEQSGLLSAKVVIIDGADAGETAELIANPAYTYWDTAKNRVTTQGYSLNQVQAVWVKEAVKQPAAQFPGETFPASAQRLEGYYESIARNIKTYFPNTQTAYYSSRIYGGYTVTDLNPEPYAYESGFSVKWLIEKQMNGTVANNYNNLNWDVNRGAVVAPWIAWGPYLWADGLNPRSDGLKWDCNDVANNAHSCDGTHPSRNIDATTGSTCSGTSADPTGQIEGGIHKVGRILVDFFKTDTVSCSWFLGSPGQNCLNPASPSPLPSGVTGDVDGNGQVENADLILVLNSLESSGLCMTGDYNCDLNADQKVNMIDAAVVISHLIPPVASPSSFPSPSIEPSPTPTTDAALPLGPFNPPQVEYGYPFTGGFLDLKISTALATLASAKASNMHVFVHFTGGRSNFQTSTGAFDLTKWKAQLDNWKSLVPQIQAYVDDGTITGHMMLDEPQDPNNWDGNTVPCSDILGAADYSHSAAFWPNMPAGAGTHATWIADQSCDWLSSKFDFTLTPYTYARGQTYQDFLSANLDAASRGGFTFYASLNVLDGGTTKGVEMTQQQIQDAGGYFLCNGANGLTMWKWDSVFFGRTDIQAAMDYLNARAIDPSANCP